MGWRTRLGLTVLVVCGARAAQAQVFVKDDARIPTGGPNNTIFTENVELADFDGDGDVDAAWADGGSAGNFRNRLWINTGGLQGGPVGWFADESAARLPAVLDSSRDIDFGDVDADGDLDLFVANSSNISNQTSRWWINMGRAQGGVEGFFTDQSAARWLGVGINDGVSACSSIPTQFALASGGFVEWSCDAAFADLDMDGALDLVLSTYGIASTGRSPTHLFLNDGSGAFREFNPSCAQLFNANLHDGTPALWCEGVQSTNTTDTTGVEADIANEALAIELGDLDNDLDVDVLHGDKFGAPRVYTNRLASGVLAFRDITYAVAAQNWAPGPGNYDQELGDLDSDNDLDIYGVNWVLLEDARLMNNGDGTFAPGIVVPFSVERQIEADCLDYDNDGDVDAFVVSETVDDRIYANAGPALGNALLLDAAALPSVLANGQGADARDVDLDGDCDVMVATIQFEADVFYRNTGDVPDTHAPRVALLEQAADRAQSLTPTALRTQVYDNAGWYVAATNRVELEYVTSSGAAGSATMRWSGGQLFRGELPGTLHGVVDYRVVATDEQSNVGASAWRSYQSACNGMPRAYCTAKINSQGCTPAVQWVGTPSATLLAPFRIQAHSVLNNKAAILFYGHAAAATPFRGGTLCVQAPFKRTALQDSQGGPPPDDCSGFLSFDFNHHVRTGGDPALVAGAQVFAQHWYRDPSASFGTGLTDAIHFSLCP